MASPHVPSGTKAVVDQFDTYVSMQDTDASGVVYALSPANWAQDGLENLFRGAGRPIQDVLTDAIHYPVVRLEVIHARRLPLGTHVTVQTWIAEVGRTSFRIETQALSQGELCASVSRTSVALHREHGPISVPGWIRALAESTSDTMTSGTSS